MKRKDPAKPTAPEAPAIYDEKTAEAWFRKMELRGDDLHEALDRCTMSNNELKLTDIYKGIMIRKIMKDKKNKPSS